VRREGDAPASRLAILAFPDMAHPRALYDSRGCRPLLAIRQRASRSTLIAIDAV
jgi:uncharacterized protein (DUF1330 family)